MFGYNWRLTQTEKASTFDELKLAIELSGSKLTAF